LTLVVTIGGLHGAGKSTYAKAVARRFGLRYVSSGKLFRQIAKERGVTLEQLTRLASESPEIDSLIDDQAKQEAKRGNVVIEGQLAAWMAGDLADLRIYLTAPEDIRMRRIASRDKLSLEEARVQTRERERSEAERYKRYYGIDISDLSKYDLIIDTGRHSLAWNRRVINSIIAAFIDEKVKQRRS
jgi:cytidylate kinase